ncbi:hypothetical protein [Seonamhaeicola marinus]|uniref:Uncharacterized protein n=1 Tax=Seonamhaeicola marinus TaxID=1912246 RepID=A0A5D0IPF8_9FLAO|nr:hypothetical protein [Seonamhaeicola marinus]TYA84247.1 hypothetical protein FUA24_06255 [Seonamhaeicola marinus]
MTSKYFKIWAPPWQEILFIISIGSLLFKVTKFNLTQRAIDGWDLALILLISPLLICLVGQLYWRNKTLSKVLSITLSIGAIIVILMGIYFVTTTTSNFGEAFLMLAFGATSLFAAMTMYRNKHKENSKEVSLH